MCFSGDFYIMYLVVVVSILVDMYMDYEIFMVVLLYDVIEDIYYSQEDLVDVFGDIVVDLVEGVSKLDKIVFSSK